MRVEKSGGSSEKSSARKRSLAKSVSSEKSAGRGNERARESVSIPGCKSSVLDQKLRAERKIKNWSNRNASRGCVGIRFSPSSLPGRLGSHVKKVDHERSEPWRAKPTSLRVCWQSEKTLAGRRRSFLGLLETRETWFHSSWPKRFLYSCVAVVGF
jgi:hypothetical protein